MRTSLARNAGVVVALVVLLAVSSLTALAAASAAPSTPVPTPVVRTGAGNWQTIAGDPQEFAFVYNGGGKPVSVHVAMDPAKSVRFDVYTDEQWHAMAFGDRSVQPLAHGTANPNLGGDLFWEGGSASGGLYHVQVYSITGKEVRFWIELNGNSGSGLTAMSPAVTPSAAPTARAVPTATPTWAERAGIGNWQTIDDQPQEFTFEYSGRSQQAEVRVGADPASGVGFRVYTDEAWRAGGRPIAWGTPNKDETGNLFWAPGGQDRELYHVQVFSVTGRQARFWIDITGPGASNFKAMSPAVSAK